MDEVKFQPHIYKLHVILKSDRSKFIVQYIVQVLITPYKSTFKWQTFVYRVHNSYNVIVK